jgi:hypothetical protein
MKKLKLSVVIAIGIIGILTTIIAYSLALLGIIIIFK